MPRISPERFAATLADVLPEMFAAIDLRPDSCILATRIGTLVARELGVQAGALPVRVAAMNASYAEMMNEWSESEEHHDDPYLPEDQRAAWSERGAWCVMLGFGEPLGAQRPGYDGHVVLSVARRYMVDLTIGQARREEKGILVEPFVMECPEFVRGEKRNVALTAPEGGTVVYWHHDRRAYLNASDWRDVRKVDRFTRRLTARVRKELRVTA